MFKVISKDSKTYLSILVLALSLSSLSCSGGGGRGGAVEGDLTANPGDGSTGGTDTSGGNTGGGNTGGGNTGGGGTTPPDPNAPVLVYFPQGSCQTGELEVEVFSTDASCNSGAGGTCWMPHPRFPSLNAGSCFDEIRNTAETNLRVRCVDSTGAMQASTWIGPAIQASAGTDSSVCQLIL